MVLVVPPGIFHMCISVYLQLPRLSSMAVSSCQTAVVVVATSVPYRTELN